jgi:hypothetical protein
MKWRHNSESVVARTPDEPFCADELSTIHFADWPDEVLRARAAVGLPTRCDPAALRCRLVGRCRVCGAKP